MPDVHQVALVSDTRYASAIIRKEVTQVMKQSFLEMNLPDIRTMPRSSIIGRRLLALIRNWEKVLCSGSLCPIAKTGFCRYNAGSLKDKFQK